MAKKTVKKTVKKEVAKQVGPGRPKGVKNRIHEGLEVVETRGISKMPEVSGYRRVVLATNNKDHALRLERLATLITKQDKNLMSLITPVELKRVKKGKAQTSNA